MDRSVFIAPSILSSDFSNLKADLDQLEKGGADWVHVDVMDGHFVPNITFGPAIVKTIRKVWPRIIDVHLMIEKPERYIEHFANAGADIITVHYEACVHLHRVIQQIKDAGCKAGVSLNPATSVSLLNDVIDFTDMVLIMSVNPGFGGQKFIDRSFNRIREAAALMSPEQYLQIDGGVDESNALAVVEAGCNSIVAGTGVFKYENRADGVKAIRNSVMAK